MATTTNFNTWLIGVDTDDSELEDLYCLMRSVDETTTYGAFTTTANNNNQWFVKCDYIDDTLMLASQLAKETFMKHLDANYGGELGIMSEYEFRQQMNKND